jgi:hypothetical protein
MVGFARLKLAIDESRSRLAQSHFTNDDVGTMTMIRPHALCSLNVSKMSVPVLGNDVVNIRERFTERHCQLPEGCVIPSSPGVAMYRERELRAFCVRLVGWADETTNVVDDMMDTLVNAIARRSPIALRGVSDLVPTAYALHRRLFGSERPFVVCDPRRREGDGSVRSPPNRRTGLLAFDAAAGGSVCIRANRLPVDFEALATILRQESSATMLFVCLNGNDPIRDLLHPPIEIPSLAQRVPDLERLLDEFLAEAAAALNVAAVRLSERTRSSILRSVASLADLEKTALRLVAIASSRNMSQAAQRLHIAPVSLSRWVCRRWSPAWLSDSPWLIDAANSASDSQ